MNKYKLTFEDSSKAITFSTMSEERAKDFFLPKNGSYLITDGKMVVKIELIA